MTGCKNRIGMTIFEILVAVAIMAILVTAVIGISKRIINQGRIRLTQSELEILVTALEQYYDFDERFPPDCNDNSQTVLWDALSGTIGDSKSATFRGPGKHSPEFSSSEVLYYFLNKVSQSSRIARNISNSLMTPLDDPNKPEMEPYNPKTNKYDPRSLVFDYGNSNTSDDIYLNRFIDPWGISLRYKYDSPNFPKLSSAGPDKLFGTDDDISSR